MTNEMLSFLEKAVQVQSTILIFGKNPIHNKQLLKTCANYYDDLLIIVGIDIEDMELKYKRIVHLQSSGGYSKGDAAKQGIRINTNTNVFVMDDLDVTSVYPFLTIPSVGFEGSMATIQATSLDEAIRLLTFGEMINEYPIQAIYEIMYESIDFIIMCEEKDEEPDISQIYSFKEKGKTNNFSIQTVFDKQEKTFDLHGLKEDLLKKWEGKEDG